MTQTSKKLDIYKLVGTGILTAIVVVLQSMAIGIKFGQFSITLVLVPIVVGAALYGVMTGAWLGLVFGAVVLYTDSATFMAISVPGTVITVLAKGMLAGLVSALVYKLIENKNRLVAVICAAVACAVTNTGVFLLGCTVFFLDTMKEWAAGAGYENAAVYMILGLVGLNFLVELGVNVLLSTAIERIIRTVKKVK